MLQPRVEMLPPAQQRFRPELRGAAFRTTGGHRPGPIMLNVDAAAELRRVAKRMVWFKPPEEALADSALFLSYAMTYGTVDDLRVVRAH